MKWQIGIPEQPPKEVTHVWDDQDDVWIRTDVNTWVYDSDTYSTSVNWTWEEIVTEYGPLHD